MPGTPEALLATLADASAKSLPILALAGLACLALRRSSAASRHLACTLAAGGLVALPLVSALAPRTPDRIAYVETRTAPEARDLSESEIYKLGRFDAENVTRRNPPAESKPGATAAPAPAGPRPAHAPAPVRSWRPPASWLAWGWLAGALATLGPWLLGLLACGWRGIRLPRVASGPWFEEAEAIRLAYGMGRRVVLRVGPAGSIPATWGTFRPTVLLPADAGGWSPGALRAVLRHELAHAHRCDFLAQGVSRVACALHWFNPLAWWLDRRLRAEAERAGDDLALRSGSLPSDYAGHLVDVARASRTRGSIGPVAMARPGALEGRIRAILEPGRDRRGASRKLAATLALALLGLLAPMGSFRLVARPPESPQAPAPRPDPGPVVEKPAPAPAEAPDGPWRKTLPGGITVELLGLIADPGGPEGWNPDGTIRVDGPWWAPDGSPLPRPPAGKTWKSRDGGKVREVAVRTTGVPPDAYLAWGARPGGMGGGSSPGRAADDGLGAVRRFSLEFPADLAAATIRFGVAAGPWKAEAASDGRGSNSTQKLGEGDRPVSILFTRAREAGGRASIVVTDTIRSDREFRVAAIDRTGRAHSVAQGSTSGNGEIRQSDAEFNLPLDQVERFELQSRPYAWAEFPGVPLDVKLPPPDAPKAAPRPRHDPEARAKSRIQFRLVEGPPVPPGRDVNTFRPVGPKRDQPSILLDPGIPLDEADVAGVGAFCWGTGGWDVRVEFTEEGAKAFAGLAREHPRRRLAIVLDGRVLDASMIEELRADRFGDRPPGGDFATGRLDEFDAKTIAAALNDVVEPGVAHPRPARLALDPALLATMGGSQVGRGSICFGGNGGTVGGLGIVPDGSVGMRFWESKGGEVVSGDRTFLPPGWKPELKRGLTLLAPERLGAALGADESVMIWAMEKKIKPFGVSIPKPHAKSLGGARFSPDGKLLATWGDENLGHGDQEEIKLWKVATGELIRTHRDVRVAALAFSPDGRTMASAGADRRITLWESGSGKVVRILDGHRGPILALAFSPDGRALATGDVIHEGMDTSSTGRIGWRSVSGEVRHWDPASGQLIRAFAGLGAGLAAVAVSPDGARVAGSTYYDGVTRVWDAATGATLATFAVPDVGVIDSLFAPGGRVLATVGTDGVIRTWDAGP